VGQSTNPERRLFLYGCDIAAEVEGQNFISRLAQITGADVAASQDATGSAALGGNWNLEYASGSIEANIAVSQQAQQDWAHVMAITAGNNSSAATPTGTTDTSLTWSHTVGAGSNGILIVDVSIFTNSGNHGQLGTYDGTPLNQNRRGHLQQGPRGDVVPQGPLLERRTSWSP